MRLVVNGNSREVSTEVRTLASALNELGFSNMIVATAVNGVFVPAQERERQTLADGDQLEVLAPMQGG